jgi:hypothetical protein
MTTPSSSVNRSTSNLCALKAMGRALAGRLADPTANAFH